MVEHTCNPSTQKVNAGGSRVGGQPGLHSETVLRKKKKKKSWVPMFHACNPSHPGGRDQEDLVESQPRKIVCETLSQKKKKKK
jgi:hypothetical protein